MINDIAGRVTVPTTSITVSRLGFGAARLFAGPERRSSGALIECALKLGIRHFDTAPSYANGESESMLGDVLAGQTGVTVTSKVGIACTPRHRSPLGTGYRLLLRPLLARFPNAKATLLRWRQQLRRPSPPQAPPPPRILSRDEILRNLEQSLQRLRRSRIEIYLIHEPDQFILDDTLAGVFADLQRQGLIGAWGLGYGRAAVDAPAFGQVLQCAPLPRTPADTRLRILHGFLRNPDTRHRPAGQRIADALQAHPDSTVLVSASSPHSLAEIAKAISR